mgnify:FL=1|jgi:uncharacterized OsmC-like protein|tara:strand:- start:252 stop:587 length:336 start_codon:yes stop_codon:yes gene_type:complete
MKKTILAGLFCGSVVGAAVILKKERVIVEEIKVTQLNEKDDTPQISVKVTLTKYQLRKMLDILEEYHTVHNVVRSSGLPAHIQDVYTFTSVAKENKQSGEYTLSSTHLSRK